MQRQDRLLVPHQYVSPSQEAEKAPILPEVSPVVLIGGAGFKNDAVRTHVQRSAIQITPSSSIRTLRSLYNAPSAFLKAFLLIPNSRYMASALLLSVKCRMPLFVTVWPIAPCSSMNLQVAKGLYGGYPFYYYPLGCLDIAGDAIDDRYWSNTSLAMDSLGAGYSTINRK